MRLFPLFATTERENPEQSEGRGECVFREMTR
jgi:hypothetical protein